MSYSESNMNMVEAIVRTSASISLICAAAILADVSTKWKHMSGTPSRMVVWWIIASIVPVPMILFGRSELPKPNEYPNPICMIQGLSISYGYVASALWSGFMALNIYLVICRKWAIESILKIEWIYHVIAWSVPLLLATFPLLTRSPDAMPTYYGDAGLWCWVSSSFAPYRFIYFGAVWLVFLVTIIVYIGVGFEVRDRMITKESSQNENEISSRMRFVIMTSLYIAAFFMTFIGATINRLALLAGSNSYVLFLIQAATMPAIGTFAAIAYFGRHFLTCYTVFRQATSSIGMSSTVSMTGSRSANTLVAHTTERCVFNRTYP